MGLDSMPREGSTFRTLGSTAADVINSARMVELSWEGKCRTAEAQEAKSEHCARRAVPLRVPLWVCVRESMRLLFLVLGFVYLAARLFMRRWLLTGRAHSKGFEVPALSILNGDLGARMPYEPPGLGAEQLTNRESMRIGVNLLYLRPDQVGGGEIFVRHLVEALERRAGVCSVLFCNKLSAETFDATESMTVITVSARGSSLQNRLLDENLTLRRHLRRQGIEVLLTPISIGPLVPLGIPQVVTVHDLLHTQVKDQFSPLERWGRTLLTGLSILRSAHVIAVSDFTRDMVIARFPIAAHRISRVYEGVVSDLRPPPDRIQEVRDAYKLKADYFFYPAMLTPHKNHVFLLRAFAKFLDRAGPDTARLVLTGKQTPYLDVILAEIERLSLQDHVRYLGLIPRGDLLAVLAGATAVLYPSRFEGFGLPVLEAMQCGVPVAASDVSSLPEVAGDAALLLPAGVLGEWVDAMLRLSLDNELRARLVCRGKKNASRFSWDKCARQSVIILEKVVADYKK